MNKMKQTVINSLDLSINELKKDMKKYPLMHYFCLFLNFSYMAWTAFRIYVYFNTTKIADMRFDYKSVLLIIMCAWSVYLYHGVIKLHKSYKELQGTTKHLHDLYVKERENIMEHSESKQDKSFTDDLNSINEILTKF